jgi:hypothetical protein
MHKSKSIKTASEVSSFSLGKRLMNHLAGSPKNLSFVLRSSTSFDCQGWKFSSGFWSRRMNKIEPHLGDALLLQAFEVLLILGNLETIILYRQSLTLEHLLNGLNLLDETQNESDWSEGKRAWSTGNTSPRGRSMLSAPRKLTFIYICL